jgi:hypothetical protein
VLLLFFTVPSDLVRVQWNHWEPFTMTSIYNTCSATHGDDLALVVQCVSEWVETVTSQAVNATSTQAATEPAAFPAGKYVEAAELNRWLLVLSGAMVFFMQVRISTASVSHLRVQQTRNGYLSPSIFVALDCDRPGSPWFVPVRFVKRT